MRRIKVLLAVVSAAATMMLLAVPAMAVDFSSDGVDIEGASCATVCIFSNDSGSGGSLDHDISAGGNTLSFDRDLGRGDLDTSINGPGTLIGGTGNGGISFD